MNLHLFVFIMRLLAAGMLALFLMFVALMALTSLSQQSAGPVIVDEVTGCQYVYGRDGRVYPRTDRSGIHHLGCRAVQRQGGLL